MVQLKTPVDEEQRLWVPPLVLPVLAMIVGIGLSKYFPHPVYGTLFIPLGLAGFIVWKKSSFVFPGLLLLAIGFGALHQYYFDLLPSNHIRNFIIESTEAQDPKVWLTGWVSTPAVINQPVKTFPYHSQPNLRTRFLIHAQEIRVGGITSPTTGRVEISLPGMVDRYQPGQKLKIKGRLVSTQRPPSPFALKNQTDFAHNNHLFARLYVQTPEDITFLTYDPHATIAILEKTRQYAQSILSGDELPTGENTVGLVNAFILGDRHQIQNELNQAMLNIGATHLLAVSGFNLAVLAGALWTIGSILNLSRRFITIIIIVSTIVYAFLTDLQPSVVRATLMILLLSIGSLFNRRTNALNSLALSALIILLINPNQLFNPGFQLSFVSSASLILLTNPIYHFVFAPRTHSKFKVPQPPSSNLFYQMGLLFLEKVKTGFCASLAAGVGTLPLVMYHFNLVSPMAPFSTMLLFLPATLLTLAGFLQLVLAILFPPACIILVPIIDYTCQWFSAFALILSKVPGASIDVFAPPGYLMLAYFLGIFFPIFFRTGRKVLRRCIRVILLLITILTYFTLWLWADSPCNTWAYVPADSEGQSVVIYTGKGLAFIDCGASHEGKLGEWSRLAACQFFAQPQLAILTHPSQEYFNDFWSIASETPHFPVFLLPNFANSRASDDEPVKTLLNSGDYFHNCATGTQILHDRIKFCILFAPQELISFNRNLAQTGGVVLADLGATKIVVASELAPYACGFLCRNYPDLRAQTLIINGSSSHGRLMERLIAHLQVQTLVVTGRLRFSERNFYQSLSIKYNFNFVEAIRKGGVLITGKE